MSREDLETIAAFARDHDLVVIADEIYAELTYDAPHTSITNTVTRLASPRNNSPTPGPLSDGTHPGSPGRVRSAVAGYCISGECSRRRGGTRASIRAARSFSPSRVQAR